MEILDKSQKINNIQICYERSRLLSGGKRKKKAPKFDEKRQKGRIKKVLKEKQSVKLQHQKLGHKDIINICTHSNSLADVNAKRI